MYSFIGANARFVGSTRATARCGPIRIFEGESNNWRTPFRFLASLYNKSHPNLIDNKRRHGFS